jgi:hypothetical protein
MITFRRAGVVLGHAALWALVVSAWPAAARAEAGVDVTLDEAAKKTLRAHRTATPPLIDGKLDDAVWADAEPDDRFRQRYPKEGAEPTQHTTVRVLYDDDAVYLAARMDDSDPDAIVARLTRRDREVESDTIVIAFDSRHDHSTAYSFFLNAAGVQRDALLFDDTEWSGEWDAVWDGAVSIDDKGWSAEFRIPLSALRFSDAPVQDWGLQVERYTTRTQESDVWTFTPQSMNAQVSPLGHLVGLEGLQPRRTLELRPFVVARLRTQSDRGGAAFGFDPAAAVDEAVTAGLDAKVGLTSNLTLDATVNPDFGQVDADRVVLNLSHLELYFPEKRPFFLEGTDIFKTALTTFYSRRIGRASVIPDQFTQDGHELTLVEKPGAIPIRAALKLSGKLGDHLALGTLEAVTGPDQATAVDENDSRRSARFVAPMSYAVARAKYNLRGSSFLGAMFTGVTRLGDVRAASLDHDGYTQSLDGAFRSEDTRWHMAAQLVASERVGGTGFRDDNGDRCDPAVRSDCKALTRNDGQRLAPGDVGVGLDLEGRYRGEHLQLDLTARSLSPKLGLNDLGYWPSVDRHVGELQVGYHDREPGDVFQNWGLSVGTRQVTTFDLTSSESKIGVEGGATLRSFWSFHAESNVTFPGQWDHFETQDGAFVERLPGIYAGFGMDSDPRGTVVVGLWTDYAHRFARAAWDYDLELKVLLNLIAPLEIELNPQLSLSGGALRNWFSDPCEDDAGAACTIDTDRRHYRFAQLDAGSLSLTARLGYTFSPHLSLQAYAQLFLDRGRWSGYGVVDTSGPSPFIRFADVRAAPEINGDLDGDGKKDDDFQDVSLNLNVVLRWEYAPGATLLAVYTRAQASALVLAGEEPRLSVRGLTTGPTEDVFLIKLAAFFGS